MIVGDDDTGTLHFFKHVGRDEFPVGIVAVGIARLEHTKPIFNRQARSNDQESTGEVRASSAPFNRIESERNFPQIIDSAGNLLKLGGAGRDRTDA